MHSRQYLLLCEFEFLISTDFPFGNVFHACKHLNLPGLELARVFFSPVWKLNCVYIRCNNLYSRWSCCFFRFGCVFFAHFADAVQSQWIISLYDFFSRTLFFFRLQSNNGEFARVQILVPLVPNFISYSYGKQCLSWNGLLPTNHRGQTVANETETDRLSVLLVF